jgi:DHA1 family tetracycline resistance protein-like MFS transporter
LLGAAFGLGFVLGPAIGSLAALGGPHIPFFVAAVVAGVNAVVAIRRLPETHAARNRGPNAGRPLTARPGLLRGIPPRALRLILVAFLSLYAFSGFESTFAELVDDRFRFSIASTGAIFTVIGLALVFVQAGLIHPVQMKLGTSGTLRFGLVCNAIGLACLAADAGWTSVVPALALLVLGQGLASPTLSSSIAGEAPADQRGRLLGFQQSAGSFARFIGPLAAGALYQHVGIPSPYLVGAAVVLAAIVLVPGTVSDDRPAAMAGAAAPPAV